MRNDELTDSELVLAAQAGDKVAFGQLVERHLPLARRVAMQMIAHQEIAWELAQEALLEAYLSLDTLREPARFQSWLYGIVRNVCRSYVRSQKAAFFSLEAMSGGELYGDELYVRYLACGPAFDPQVIVERRELANLLAAAIEALSPKNKAVVRLFYDEQLSLQEIAAQLGLSVNVVKNRLFHARKQLQTRLASTYTPTYRPFALPVVNNDRRLTMVKISSIHAVEGVLSGNYILYLLDTTGGRMLQIWVGSHEGAQIAQFLQGKASPRPLTYRFMASLLDTLGAKLQEVRVEALKEMTFYAVVKAQNGKAIHEIDARPSDALALALQMKCPIFVNEELMTKAGQPLPQPFDEQTWLQQETEHMAEMARLAQVWEQKLQEETGPATPAVVQIFKQARTLAQGFNHNYIGTEHLLLALAQDQQTNAAKVLHELGVEQAQAAAILERLFGRGLTAPMGEPVIVPRVIQVLEMAEEERRTHGQAEIGAEHLLLGILREGEGVAITILRELGVDLEQVRMQLLVQL
ncbi:MAG: bifunctional nuclease domain-containing protein [Caldilineaceae bacterium]